MQRDAHAHVYDWSELDRLTPADAARLKAALSAGTPISPAAGSPPTSPNHWSQTMETDSSSAPASLLETDLIAIKAAVSQAAIAGLLPLPVNSGTSGAEQLAVDLAASFRWLNEQAWLPKQFDPKFSSTPEPSSFMVPAKTGVFIGLDVYGEKLAITIWREGKRHSWYMNFGKAYLLSGCLPGAIDDAIALAQSTVGSDVKE